MTEFASSAELRAEADALVAGGLGDVLSAYAPYELVGSYSTDLMAWRDLDIELYPSSFDVPAFYQLGCELGLLLRPARMSFRDELQMCTPRNPKGLYWGIFLGDDRRDSWKLDVWAVDSAHATQRRERDAAFVSRLTSSTRDAILRIKREVFSHPAYRKQIYSEDIYHAVLDEGIRNANGFWEHLRGKGVAV